MAASCVQSGSSTAAPPSPSINPSPNSRSATARPTPLAHRPAASAILEDGAVGLPRVAGRDHVGLAQAAEEQQNQPLALTRYRSWGWLDQATRTWSSGDRRVEEELVVLTSEQGARLAFFDSTSGGLPGSECSAELHVDDCRKTGDAAASNLVARLGPYLFRLKGTRLELADLTALGAAQSARLRRPCPGTS